jgi:tetratricopeptide (TPR) repeat protein
VRRRGWRQRGTAHCRLYGGDQGLEGRAARRGARAARRRLSQQGRAQSGDRRLQPGHQDQAHDHKGDHDRALQDFDQAIKLKPSALAHFNRGNAHLGKSQFEQAIEDYDQAIRFKPDFAAAYDNRCWARAVTGNLKPALADCNQAIRLAPPGNAGTFESRGFIFMKMTNFDAAVSDFEAALRRNPSLPGALYGRGMAKLWNSDNSGEADILAAKALQSDIAEEYARYGMRPAR